MNRRSKYRAIKILTAHATNLHRDGQLFELEVIQSIPPFINHLYDHFEIDGPHGHHLCLVYRPLSETVGSFRRSAPSQSLSVAKVKVIVSEVLEALCNLHAANIIHRGP